jgi:DNA-binding CsgD family transcriptional regulator
MKSVLAFASFVLWLHAFPLSGYLLAESFCPISLQFFLPPLILVCFVLPALSRTDLLKALSTWSSPALFPVTILFALIPEHRTTLLFLSGLIAPFVLLQCVALLRGTLRPRRSLAGGIVLGNVLLGFLLMLPAPPLMEALVVGAFPMVCVSRRHPTLVQGSIRGFVAFLPFIFAYFFVSGLMYGDFLPAYATSQILQGGEILVYIVALVAALAISEWNRELPFVLGLALAMLAMSFFQSGGDFGANAGMAVMQTSAAMIDLFVFSLFLLQSDIVRTVGYGTGIMVLGILCGDLFTMYLAPWTGMATLAGNIALVASIPAFYLYRKKEEEKGFDSRDLATATIVERAQGEQDCTGMPCGSRTLPPGLSGLLSEQERRVLNLVLSGSPFSETARELGISPSSVKTYMRRIYEKAGVTGKDMLIDLFEKTRQTPSDSRPPMPKPQ